MKKVTMIVMPGCPYCANAKKALAALQKEAAYRDVQVELVDETSEADKVKPYAGAYYYVPTLFVNHDKSYEAHPGDTYEVICEAVEKALAAANNFPPIEKPAARGVPPFCRFFFIFWGRCPQFH